MATYSKNLQMWRASDGTYHNTQADAEAAEAAGTTARETYTDEEFAASTSGLANGESQFNVLRTEITPEELEATRASRASREEETRLASIPYGTPVAQGGTATEYTVEQHPTGTINTSRGNIRNAPARVVSSGGGPGSSMAPGAITGPNAERADARTNAAEAQSLNTDAENEYQNENLWSDVYGKFNDLDGANYEMSDEARQYQREGLQQQRELLERLLGFDPNQYAAQFADQAMARQIAVGRQGTTAAQQQTGMFAAMEGAPAMYAEGARQASALENQRLQAAQGVTKTFGELGTMTRGQDETRAQFDAELPLEIANSFSQAVQGKMTLNEQESQRMAEVWMNFAQLQSVYDQMSLTEQLAWWDREMAEKGLKQQYDMFKQELAAQGKVQEKDLLGGLLQLGGGLLSGGFSVLAAGA